MVDERPNMVPGKVLESALIILGFSIGGTISTCLAMMGALLLFDVGDTLKLNNSNLLRRLFQVLGLGIQLCGVLLVLLLTLGIVRTGATVVIAAIRTDVSAIETAMESYMLLCGPCAFFSLIGMFILGLVGWQPGLANSFRKLLP